GRAAVRFWSLRFWSFRLWSSCTHARSIDRARKYSLVSSAGSPLPLHAPACYGRGMRPAMCALIGIAAVALACSTKVENRFAPPPIAVSPDLSPLPGVADQVSTDKERAAIRLALTKPTDRDGADAILKDVYRQAMPRIGLEPSTVEILLYAAPEKARAAPDTPLASCTKRQSDRGPTFENKIPLSFPKA